MRAVEGAGRPLEFLELHRTIGLIITTPVNAWDVANLYVVPFSISPDGRLTELGSSYLNDIAREKRPSSHRPYTLIFQYMDSTANRASILATLLGFLYCGQKPTKVVRPQGYPGP